MLNERTRPIGYLLKILNISYTALATAIYVDRTVVNKWVLGKRDFNLSSPHYQGVVEYIIRENERKGEHTLENFFGNIYAIPKDESYLENCIKKFLADEDISMRAYSVAAQAENCMIFENMPVYGNTYGRFTALIELLKMALKSDKKQDIMLFDNEQFVWLMAKESYLKAFVEQVQAVLQDGHRVTIISSTYNPEIYERFSIFIQSFFPYKNFREYVFNIGAAPYVMFSQYYIKDKIVIFGNRMKTSELSTIIMRDAYSLSSAEERMKNLIEMSNKHILAGDDDHRYKMMELLQESEGVGEQSFLYVPTLSFLSMSKELLLEILRNNRVYGRRRDEFVDFYEKQREIIDANINCLNHMCYLDRIAEMLSKSEFYSQEMSIICGKKIVIQRELVLWHIKDTIELIENNKGFRLGFLRELSPDYSEGFSCRIKRNSYFAVCRTVLRFWNEPNAVNYISLLFEKEWANITLREDNDKRKTVKILRELIGESCKKLSPERLD